MFQDTDLGRVDAISKVVAELQPKLEPGNFVQVSGQIESMNESFRNLGIGLLFAAVFVFALMVVNYQNFGDPFVVLLALPATFCGILVTLFITGTTLNVPSLMGAIMAVGVASANSILLVTFAHEQQLAGKTSFQAAVDAGYTRIRPVLMTAAAMIVGMLPMAIGGRRRGAERGAGARRHWRSLVRNADDTPRRALSLRHAQNAQRRQDGAWRLCGGYRMKGKFQLIVSRNAARSSPRPPPIPLGDGECACSGSARCSSCSPGWVSARGAIRRSIGKSWLPPSSIEDFVPKLRVATINPSADTIVVTLPATTAAFVQANVFARASGYIDKRNADIGDHVKEGQLLAHITAPEIEHQIAQAQASMGQSQAALQQAQANAQLADVTWGRDKPLVAEGWVTKQQGAVDEQTLQAQQAAVGVAQSNLAAQQAQLKVLQQQQDYQSVVAPFDGVITQRNVDVGSLVQADSTTGTFMFTIMQSSVIRTQVHVPQDQAFGLGPGVGAEIRVPEIPGRDFPGKVTRVADALEPNTRTLLTEIDVPNPDGALTPGICTVELRHPA